MMRKIDWKTHVYWGFQSGHPVFVNVNPYDISKKTFPNQVNCQDAELADQAQRSF